MKEETTQLSGLSDYELELEKIVDEIRNEKETLKAIAILKKYVPNKNAVPLEMTKEELTNYVDFLTVGKLKKFLEEHPLPDNAKVVVQRVEDRYYEHYSWSVYLKKGEHWWSADQWNKDVESGKYLDKDQYPKIKEENLKLFTEEQMKLQMEQYHPAWSCVYYSDDKDILFIDLHY